MVHQRLDSCPSGPQGLCSGATGCSVTSHPITLQILHSSSLGRTGLGCMRDRSPALIPEEIANSVICVNALSSFPLLRLSAAYWLKVALFHHQKDCFLCQKGWLYSLDLRKCWENSDNLGECFEVFWVKTTSEKRRTGARANLQVSSATFSSDKVFLVQLTIRRSPTEVISRSKMFELI